MTADERSQVIELKKKAKEQGKSSSKAATGKRKASAAGTSDRDQDDNKVEEGEAEDEEEPTNQAGNEFGRAAHAKKKKVNISTVVATVIPSTNRTSASRHVLAVSSRRVMDTARLSDGKDGGASRVELDTHADTCVAGSNTVVLDLTGKVVTVAPFCQSEYQPVQDIPIATVATAYDCPVTGKTYVLIINEALYFGDKMRNTLLNPNQLRTNGIQVHDCPKQFDPSSRHSILIPATDLEIPLSMEGVISGFTSRIPTQAELDDFSYHVELT